MPVQSQPLPPDAEDAPKARGLKEKVPLPWWIYFADLPDAVPWVAFLGGLVWFNRSERGRAFYASLAKQFPNKEDLASHMMQTITGRAASTFWVMVAGFGLLDLLHWPKFLYKLKIQTRDPPTPGYFAKVTLINLVNTFLFLAPFSKYLWYPLWKKRGGVELATKIPSTATSIKEFVMCELWFEFWLYTSHRIMHLPQLYSWAHKTHHVNSSPFTVANFYATPFEHLFQNNFAGLAMHLLPVHPSTAWFYVAYRYFETATSHSGYAIPFASNSLFHNYHHRMFEGSYGINVGFPLMDLLMGTADDYLQWRYKWAKTHHWFTNQKLVEDKEVDQLGVDMGGAAF